MWAELTAAHLDKPSELMALTEQLTVQEKDRDSEEKRRKTRGVGAGRGVEGANRRDYDDK